MRRGEIYWADLGPPYGRRPALVLTRTPAITFLTSVIIAPVTRTVRGIASEVAVGADEGLRRRGVASCDNLMTVPMPRFDPKPIGALARSRIPELDRALRYALEIRY